MTDVAGLQPSGAQVTVSAPLGVNTARRADGSAAVHLVNFGYDPQTDEVPVMHDVEISIRLPFDAVSAEQVSSDGGTTTLEVIADNGVHTLRLPRVRLYDVVTLSPESGTATGEQPAEVAAP
jgi:hypothetical protein